MPDPGVRTSELGVLSALTDDDRFVIVNNPAGSAVTQALPASDARAAMASRPLNAQTGTTYTVTAADVASLVTLTNAAAITVTLPTPTSLGVTAGMPIDFAVLGAGMATFTAGAGATVNATPSAVTRAQYSAVTAVAISTTAWLLVGDLA